VRKGKDIVPKMQMLAYASAVAFGVWEMKTHEVDQSDPQRQMAVSMLEKR
jgi:hypothetical protein